MELPLGVPKMVLSPIASGRHLFDPLVGTSDMIVMHTVVDILGLNAIACSVFDNTAAAMAGMVKMDKQPSKHLSIRRRSPSPCWVTQQPRRWRCEVLAEAGLDGVVFHANGVGGPAMEELVDAGHFIGVVDLTVSELVGNVMGGVHVGGDDRLRSAGGRAYPRWWCRGVWSSPSSAPLDPRPPVRPREVRPQSGVRSGSNLDDMLAIADDLADRINGAKGLIRVVIPAEGFSIPNVPGEFYDPATMRVPEGSSLVFGRTSPSFMNNCTSMTPNSVGV